ncbi:MAG TPA: hypothetical protein P5555_08870 [Candidatus Paceibacterota bacterium]|nr:hypothetical protein [Verrucomicrobiota bacterium]HOX02090.1 hypothetical protein [Verrucomicrobiota bacterium]HRZ45286.1 hypothetical protein [Candidatus Paceibacterota bacterium]HRZ91549.1 hypothetical protein [Candidatus Paceibacterota bacterium]
MPPSRWMPGKPIAEKARVLFPNAPLGEHRLALALTRKPCDTAPHVRLGTDLPMADGWYVLGRIDLARPSTAAPPR